MTPPVPLARSICSPSACVGEAGPAGPAGLVGSRMANVMPRRYRSVAVASMTPPLTEERLRRHFLGAEAEKTALAKAAAATAEGAVAREAVAEKAIAQEVGAEGTAAGCCGGTGWVPV